MSEDRSFFPAPDPFLTPSYFCRHLVCYVIISGFLWELVIPDAISFDNLNTNRHCRAILFSISWPTTSIAKEARGQRAHITVNNGNGGVDKRYYST